MAMIGRRTPDAQVLSDPRAAAILEAHVSSPLCDELGVWFALYFFLPPSD